MAHQPEPFAMAEFEIHRVITEASGNPFLRASSAIVEFGVAVNVVARLTADRQPPPEGLAAHHAARYEALVRAIERGDVDAAGALMAELTSQV